MAKDIEKSSVQHDFTASTEAELNAAIAAFKADWTGKHADGLAIDGKRSLGPGKFRITFRVVPAKNVRRR